MYEILEKKQYSETVFYMKIRAPEIAESRQAGQFVIIQLNTEYGERVPLTIADADEKEGWVALVVQAVGATTIKLCRMNVGESLGSIVGPLGTPSEIEKVNHVVTVAGGIGSAPMYPIIQAHKKIGNKVTAIIGARTKELVLFEEETKKIADETIIVTDDGSYGRKGLVTEPLKELCESANPPDLVIAIGPPIMMKFAALTTKPYNIHTIVSLNTIMIDGTGMCGGCRVSVDGKTKFVCVDGPEFDAHKVDFDNMMLRMKAFKSREDADRHKCNIGLN